MNFDWGYGYGFHPVWSLFGGIFAVIVWIVIIVLIIRVLRAIFVHGQKRDWGHWKEVIKGNSAMEILKERYAKGEIEREEFETKKKDLME